MHGKISIPLQVLPLGINYSSFRFYGKNVQLNFGNFISKEDLSTVNSDGKSINEFNEKLQWELQQLIFEVDKSDRRKLTSLFSFEQPLFKKILLFFPAIIGFVINAPLYFIIHLIIKKRAVDHYDSIMTGLLFIFYPLYVLALSFLTFYFTKNIYSLLLLVAVPFTAWSYLQLKRQIKK